jgi:hypothetical protein
VRSDLLQCDPASFIALSCRAEFFSVNAANSCDDVSMIRSVIAL